MSIMKLACLESFLGANPRLVEGVFKCEIISDSNSYGNIYSVLNKRKATIIDEVI